MINSESEKGREQQHAFNRTLGLTLRTWIFITLIVMASGLILFAVQKHAFDDKLVAIYSLPGELANFDPSAIVTVGLISILLMPIGILIASFTHFIATREKKPLIICSVLLILFIAGLIIMTLFR